MSFDMSFLNNNKIWQQLPEMLSKTNQNLQNYRASQQTSSSQDTSSNDSAFNYQSMVPSFNPGSWTQVTTEQYCAKNECLFDYATYKGKDASNQGVSYDNLMKAKSTYKNNLSAEAAEFAELMCGNKELFSQVAGKDGRISREEMKQFNLQYFGSLEGLMAQQTVASQPPVSQPIYVNTAPYSAYQQPNIYVNGANVHPYQNNWVWQPPATPYSTVMPPSYYDNSWVWQEPQAMMPMYGYMDPMMFEPSMPEMIDYSAQVPMAWDGYPELIQDPLMGLVDWSGFMPQEPIQSWS